jgi:AcrR family transcriptional regulator
LTEISAQTRKRLLDASITEFSTQGYYKTNVDSITQRAGVSHGTFYIYFKSKNDILKVLMQDLMQMVPNIVDSVQLPTSIKRVVLTPELLPQFEGLVHFITETLSGASGLLKAFVQGMLQDKEIFDLSTQTIRESASVFQIVVKTVQRKGRYPGCRPEIIAEIMAICMTAAILMRSMSIITASSEELAKNITGMLYPALIFDQSAPARKNRPSSQKDQKTRKDLLEAAKAEFAAKGYFDATVADIAKRINLSRGTFYLYFKDKDEIIEAIFSDMFDTIPPMNSAPDGFINRMDASSIAELIKACTQVVNLYDTPYTWALLQGFFSSERLLHNYSHIFSLTSVPLAEKINLLKNQGRCPDVDPTITAQILITTILYAAFLRNLGALECSKEEFALNMAWFLYYFLNYSPHGE